MADNRQKNKLLLQKVHANQPTGAVLDSEHGVGDVHLDKHPVKLYLTFDEIDGTLGVKLTADGITFHYQGRDEKVKILPVANAKWKDILSHI